MIEIKKINKNDKRYYAKWWRDDYLISLTSGNYKPISDNQIDQYFNRMIVCKNRYDFMICLNKEVIGHISLVKDKNNKYELQTIIGEHQYLGKGYGKQAIKLILDFAHKNNVIEIYLYVRPDNLRAINAYKATGFVQRGDIIITNNPNQPELIKMVFSS